MTGGFCADLCAENAREANPTTDFFSLAGLGY